MIATILPSSAVFHAIDYNENKVARGDATLIEMSNIYGLSGFGPYTPDELRQYLIEYSSRNGRIKKSQFHVAVSCRGHEYSVEQLQEFAHRYLERMGYAEEGQPLVIYAHHDTENTHIHIVTSRVAPDGHKIDHNHERRKSQRVVEELEGIDIMLETENAIKEALSYGFSTTGQFRAILTSLGYESAIDEDGGIRLFRGGICRKELSPETLDNLITAHARTLEQSDERRAKRKRQLRMLFQKFQAIAINKEDFKKSMREQFGVDIVFHWQQRFTLWLHGCRSHDKKCICRQRDYGSETVTVVPIYYRQGGPRPGNSGKYNECGQVHDHNRLKQTSQKQNSGCSYKKGHIVYKQGGSWVS